MKKNILPLEYRRELKKDYFRRFSVIAFFFVSSVFLAGIIMLLPTIFFLREQENIAESELRYLKAKSGGIDISGSSRFIENFNKKLKVLAYENPFGLRTDSVKEIMSYSGAGIKVNSFSVENDGIIEKAYISGEAATRADLINFLSNLKSCKGSKLPNCQNARKVDSPVSNILKDKEIKFSINVETNFSDSAKK